MMDGGTININSTDTQKCVAIVLAAGQGKRMESTVQKQYMQLQGYPVLYYSLLAFQASKLIDEIILVVGDGEQEYCKEQLISPYKFTKVKQIVTGGKERYDSVWKALQCVPEDTDYVMIHDGARPLVTEQIISDGLESVKVSGATVAAVPSKDTIKIVDDKQTIIDTPLRKNVWSIQTPQIFSFSLVKEAYTKMQKEEHTHVTDDAMVVESYMGTAVQVYMADYKNIKITTPEDMIVADKFLELVKENN